jgi:hypothetical protein
MEPYFQENNADAKKSDSDFCSAASLFLSILSVFGSTTIFIGVLGGIAAIACGIISRVHRESFNLNSILGIVIGSIAIFLSCVVFLGVLIMIQNPEVLAQIMEIYSAQ